MNNKDNFTNIDTSKFQQDGTDNFYIDLPNIPGGRMYIDTAGNISIMQGKIKITSNSFEIDSNTSLNLNLPNNLGGRLSIDTAGNVKIGNGNFTIDPNGNVNMNGKLTIGNIVMQGNGININQGAKIIFVAPMNTGRNGIPGTVEILSPNDSLRMQQNFNNNSGYVDFRSYGGYGIGLNY